jgi:hypothetical protein
VKISSKHIRLTTHMLDSDVGWIKDDFYFGPLDGLGFSWERISIGVSFLLTPYSCAPPLLLPLWTTSPSPPFPTAASNLG